MNIGEKLREPFKESEIEWRIQNAGWSGEKPWAIVVPYIQNRAIMNRLDVVFGVMGWRNEYIPWQGNSQLCGISIWNEPTAQWITKYDGAENTQIESIKGGLSDSMKRAAVQFGIGRYLYGLDIAFAECTNERRNDWKKHYDKKLNKSMWWKPPQLPKWAIPKGTEANNDKKPNTTITPVTKPKPEEIEKDPLINADEKRLLTKAVTRYIKAIGDPIVNGEPHSFIQYLAKLKGHADYMALKVSEYSKIMKLLATKDIVMNDIYHDWTKSR